jgi:hypothetical protein
LETAANGTGHSVSKHGQCTVVSYIAMHPETKSALKDKNIFFHLEMKSYGKSS